MIQWHDITVPDAEKLSDFYSAVAGWTREGISMGDYEDYVMKDAAGNVMGGICHARGVNKDIPPGWLIYIPVDDLDKSLEECKRLGGKVMGEKRSMGPKGFYCLIQDVSGCYVMLADK